LSLARNGIDALESGTNALTAVLQVGSIIDKAVTLYCALPKASSNYVVVVIVNTG